MRRIVVATTGTVVGIVALLGSKTTSAPATSAAGGSPTTRPGTATGSANSGGPSSTGKVTGTAASTRYGPVEVEITVTDGHVTAVEAVEYPTESARDRQINAYAVPELNREALAAGNANIDVISGATYTSEGYIRSLQSALDKAGLS